MNDAPLPLKTYLLIKKNTVKCNHMSITNSPFYQ